MTEIRFGTDGWRAVADQDFTPKNVARVIEGFVRVFSESQNKKIFIGYDRRRDSRSSSELVARILATHGFQPVLSAQFCPTPAVSWLVKTQNALAGVMITASHNPAQWNGVKFKESSGAAASPEYTKQIEEKIPSQVNLSDYADFQTLLAKGQIQEFDPYQNYVEHLRKFFDLKAIQASGYHAVHDAMYGAGSGFMPALIGEQVQVLHDAADPSFGGTNPEPVAKNLQELLKTVVQKKADVGLATDGDADRIGACDEHGQFISPQYLFALLLQHYVSHRKLSGAVIKSVSTTSLIDKITQKYNLPLVITPVGFKYISGELLKRDALMGGEESGGISLREHVHERDGVFNALMLLEIMAVRGKRLSQLIDDLQNEFGPHHYDRDDYHLAPEIASAARQELAQFDGKSVADIAVVKIDERDGRRFELADGSWLLVRASGTEPLLRIYAESQTPEKVRILLNWAKSRFIGQSI